MALHGRSALARPLCACAPGADLGLGNAVGRAFRWYIPGRFHSPFRPSRRPVSTLRGRASESRRSLVPRTSRAGARILPGPEGAPLPLRRCGTGFDLSPRPAPAPPPNSRPAARWHVRFLRLRRGGGGRGVSSVGHSGGLQDLCGRSRSRLIARVYAGASSSSPTGSNEVAKSARPAPK